MTTRLILQLVTLVAGSRTARKRGLVPILLGAVTLSLVIGVAAAEVASDNELYAAYCIGVLQQKQQGQRELYLKIEQDFADDKKSQDNLKRGWQEDAKNVDQRLSRFQTYLAVRGFRPTGGRDRQADTGNQVALQRGRADEQQCYQLSEKTCIPRCTSERLGLRLLDADAPRRISECADQCRAENAACRSSERCLRDDNLPF